MRHLIRRWLVCSFIILERWSRTSGWGGAGPVHLSCLKLMALGRAMREGEDSTVVRLVEEALILAQPRTVRELLKQVHSKNVGLSEAEVLDAVESLGGAGRLLLGPPRFRTFMSFFLSPYWNTSLWLVLALATMSSLSYLSSGAFPWSLFQVLPGLLLVFYLPGHSLLHVFLDRERVQSLERMVLEIGTSIVLVMLLGLFLNFSGLGLFSAPALGSVILLNVLLALWVTFHNYYISVR